MSINKKILDKLSEKIKTKKHLDVCAIALLKLEAEGIGHYKEPYKTIIEKSVKENKSEN